MRLTLKFKLPLRWLAAMLFVIQLSDCATAQVTQEQKPQVNNTVDPATAAVLSAVGKTDEIPKPASEATEPDMTAIEELFVDSNVYFGGDIVIQGKILDDNPATNEVVISAGANDRIKVGLGLAVLRDPFRGTNTIGHLKVTSVMKFPRTGLMSCEERPT
jgi:hypothetical protein